MSTKTIEEKQYLVRFKADKKSHLTVLDQQICMEKCPEKSCTVFCPAEVYKWEGTRMHVGYEGCHECGVVVLAAHTKILNGNIRRAGMESFLN